MFKPSNYDTEKERTFFDELPSAGPYVGKIIHAEEKQSKSGNPMLVLSIDISEGQFKDYYKNLSDRISKDCFLKHYRVLTDENAGYLKGDILAIEHSNPGFIYNFDETTLSGRLVGINIREEEYVANNGNIKISLKIVHLCGVVDVRNGKIKTIKPKTFQSKPVKNELPF